MATREESLVFSLPSQPSYPANAAAVAALSPLYVANGVGGSVFVVERSRLQVAACLTGPHEDGTITCLAASWEGDGGGEVDDGDPRDGLLASGCSRGTVVVWRVGSGRAVSVLSRPVIAVSRRESVISRRESIITPRDRDGRDDRHPGSAVTSPTSTSTPSSPMSQTAPTLALAWTGGFRGRRRLVALYEGSQVVIWDPHGHGDPTSPEGKGTGRPRPGTILWQSKLRCGTLTHMTQCPRDASRICLTSDQGAVCLLHADDLCAHHGGSGPQGSHKFSEYKISASAGGKGGGEAGHFMRCRFSACCESLLHIALERTLLAFDSEYGVPLGSACIAKGMSAFSDIGHVSQDGRLLVCVHRDTSLSVWSCCEPKAIYAMARLLPTLTPSPRASAAQILIMPAGAEATWGGGGGGGGEGGPDDGSISNFEFTVWSAVHSNQIGCFFQTHAAGKAGAGGGATPCDVRGLPSGLYLESMMKVLPTSSAAFCVQPPSQGDVGDVHFVALGTSLGTVEIVDLERGSTRRSFRHHPSPVLGLRWMTRDAVLSFSSQATRNGREGREGREGGAYRNDLILTDIHSGRKVSLRVGMLDAAPLRGVRTSFHGTYFLLLFKSGVTEIWKMERDLTATRVRVLSLPFTCIQFVTSIPFFARSASTNPTDSLSAGHSRDAGSAGGAEGAGEAEEAEVSGGGGMRGRGNSWMATHRDVVVFSMPDGKMGAFEVKQKKVRDLKPDFPNISDLKGSAGSGSAVVTAIQSSDQMLIVGTSAGDVHVWSEALENHCMCNVGATPVKKIVTDPCLANDFIVLLATHTWFKLNMNMYPTLSLQVDEAEPMDARSRGSGAGEGQALDADWIKNAKGRQYLLCTRDGLFAYADHAARQQHLLLTPRAMDKLAFYMQHRCPLGGDQACAPPTPPLSLEARDVEPNLIDLDDAPVAAAPEPEIEHRLESSRAKDPLDACLEGMRAALGMSDLEGRQAMEAYRLFAAKLRDEVDVGDVHELVRYDRGPDTVDVCKALSLSASVCGYREEASFWKHLPATVASAQEGNYGARGASWDAATQKAAAAKLACWHEAFLEAVDAENMERRVLEYFVLGDRESGIAFLLASSPSDAHFYKHALQATAMASFPANCPAFGAGAGAGSVLQMKAAKVLSAHCASNDDVLSSIVILGLIGKTLDAVMQLQDVGMWEHAATMTAAYLDGDDRRAALEKWGTHVVLEQGNLWRGLGILATAGCFELCLDLLDKAGMPVGAHFLRTYLKNLRLNHDTESDGGIGEESLGGEKAAIHASHAKAAMLSEAR